MRVAVVNLTAGGLSGGYRKYLARLMPLLAADSRVTRLGVFAPEAARALLDHVLEVVPGVTIVATIRIGHEASEKVATRAGMIKTDEVTHEDGMTLAVWKRNR